MWFRGYGAIIPELFAREKGSAGITLHAAEIPAAPPARCFAEPFCRREQICGSFCKSRVNSYCLTGRCCPIGEGVSKPPLSARTCLREFSQEQSKFLLPHRQVLPHRRGGLKAPPVGENVFAGVFPESRVNSYCPIGEMREPKMAVPRRIILEPWAMHSRQSPLMPIERCSMFVSCAFARS